MNKLIISLVGILFASQAFAICPPRKIERNLCIVAPETYTHPLWRLDTRATCGYQAEVHLAKDMAALFKILDQVRASCGVVRELTFAGHGIDGYTTAGQVGIRAAQALKAYSDIMAPSAYIEFAACSIAAGCAGDLLFLTTAESLLKMGGSITGPTAVSSTFAPGVIPSFSLNLKQRQLLYYPESRPVDWLLHGTPFTEQVTVADRCQNEVEEKLEGYDRHLALAKRRGCDTTKLEIKSSTNQALKDSFAKIRHTNVSIFPEEIDRVQLVTALREIAEATRKIRSCGLPFRSTAPPSDPKAGLR